LTCTKHRTATYPLIFISTRAAVETRKENKVFIKMILIHA
jgi:hypothetical protein